MKVFLSVKVQIKFVSTWKAKGEKKFKWENMKRVRVVKKITVDFT